ncbi:preprotein translocase subunit SecE [Candidatus Roizmanbacteria bacterium RIFCSPHIGHO2_02_FULL_40_13b]|uniref:Protein translocase subunit SecE n=1 Tax=Candidatus Roizmanbacteria bacterium RIFCSPHIGHO2_01_FULL_39_24 TaxID=1802032 RepID=A0A1F7GFN4_9BACT|nr:MAG: preprotein translocase subunit SecE [Candidatus Roizmanbacteria bacterium RIFCSPHIGHO2_01_FULL_39_24]OGK27175.1 MAG: preprotein translocase subunit SecE [Candidatus Roizmanbacteria bacterium RIFCSPHIGHO2_02_FULL_40_13b]OGK49298.1 MAG: preprotein translocase subunit SecE [Candidatus Roizmanbacteria bacterium RIFCSPLOWO2_01_FULL_40_32]
MLANNFAADVVGELKKVTWPTRKEAGRLTLAVFAICLIVGVYLGIIDVVLAKVLGILTTAQ